MLAALSWSSIASAQSAGDQYAAPTAPSGPAAESQCTVSGDTNGVVDSGDQIVCAGSYDIASGSSVVLQDSDGTQGTFIDGTNATITEGSIDIAVTGAPLNVAAGNGVLNTKGLFVVATTGITAAGGTGAVASAGTGGGETQPASAVAGVLPDTGGFMLIGVFGSLALIGGGVTLLRSRLFGQQ